MLTLTCKDIHDVRNSGLSGEFLRSPRTLNVERWVRCVIPAWTGYKQAPEIILNKGHHAGGAVNV